MAVVSTLRALCHSCDHLYTSNIVNTLINCSTSGEFAYLKAGLVYSSPDGQITATTLISMFFDWLLYEDNPTLMVAGTRVALSQQCLTKRNTDTERACVNIFNSAPAPLGSATTLVPISFFPGFIAGILFTLVAIFLVVW